MAEETTIVKGSPGGFLYPPFKLSHRRFDGILPGIDGRQAFCFASCIERICFLCCCHLTETLSGLPRAMNERFYIIYTQNGLRT